MSGLRFGLNLSMQRRERLWPPCTHGPDGGLPVQESLWYRGQGWCDGSLYASVSAYLTAASGTFSRGSDGTRFDASGIMQVDGPNVLRLDHDPATGEALGARLEGQGGNMHPRSEVIDLWPGTYDNNNYPNSVIAPDGTLTADRIEKKTNDAAMSGKAWWNVVKSYEADVLGGFAASIFINSTGTVGVYKVENSSGGGYGRFLLDYSKLRAGWNRLTSAHPAVTTTPWRTYNKNIFGLIINTAQYPATGTFWGAQLEESAFATSYIPTTATAVTRLADNLSFARPGTPEGTIAVSARTALGADGSQTLWCWDDGTTANRYRLVRDSSRHLRFVATVSGTDVVNLDLGTVADDTGLKVAASWKSGLFAASLNGAAAVTDSSYAGSLPSVTTMREGSSSNGSEWFGTIKRMRRYSTAYSAAQLPGMSS